MDSRKFTIATNVSLLDLHRLRQVIPTWFESFKRHEVRIVVVLDVAGIQGRLKRNHRIQFQAREIRAELAQWTAREPRVAVHVLDDETWPAISRKWYGRTIEKRDHGGCANFAYLYALEVCGPGPILKTDSDILYLDQGWVDEALCLLAERKMDLVFPPRLKTTSMLTSSRSYFINPDSFAARLPLPVLRGDLVFRVKRWLRGANTFLGLENVYLHEVSRGRLNACLLPRELGATLHVWSPYIPAESYFPELARQFVAGTIPALQEDSWECDPLFWGYPPFISPP